MKTVKTPCLSMPHGFPAKALILMSIVLMGACNSGPKPIDYGKDACSFCRMAIVDKQHGAEIVTAKGKIYKFDAVECMLNFSPELSEPEGNQFLVNVYHSPGKLFDATEATYLISEGIPSPMGAFLTAFEFENDALKAQQKHGGDTFNWVTLKIRHKQ